MAPSRGICQSVRLPRYPIPFNQTRLRLVATRRFQHTLSPSCFAKLSGHAKSRHQLYISHSLDPYLNLSIEHYLLQKTAADSTVLFLYTNKPCVVIGRNQNPWLEANLGLLDVVPSRAPETEPPNMGNVLLVRRRSGGGTVFHDEGNVNYSVICPTSAFDRDKHAEMVVQALRKLGVEQARVNTRHDIVLDGGATGARNDLGETSTSSRSEINEPTPLKISGSAYKLTRLRALHHGTCLLSSPNLNKIPLYLHSPAKPFIVARGVESVSSPVANVGISNEAFKDNVVAQFASLYRLRNGFSASFNSSPERSGDDVMIGGVVGEAHACMPEIAKGMRELKSPAWLYQQTPQFTLSSRPEPDRHQDNHSRAQALESPARATLHVRAGVIYSSHISFSSSDDEARRQTSQVDELLKDTKLHEIDDWKKPLGEALGSWPSNRLEKLTGWLNIMTGR